MNLNNKNLKSRVFRLKNKSKLIKYESEKKMIITDNEPENIPKGDQEDIELVYIRELYEDLKKKIMDINSRREIEFFVKCYKYDFNKLPDIIRNDLLTLIEKRFYRKIEEKNNQEGTDSESEEEII